MIIKKRLNSIMAFGLAAVLLVVAMLTLAACSSAPDSVTTAVPTTTATTAPQPVGTTTTAVTTRPVVTTPAATQQEDFKFTGVIDSITKDSVTIAGKTFKLTGTTGLDAGVVTGKAVTVEFRLNNGEMTAVKVETPAADARSGEDFKFSGTVQSVDAKSVVIDGKSFKVADNTLLDTALASGKKATVEFQLNKNGEMEAVKVETPDTAAKQAAEDIKFTGVVDSVGADNVVVGGKTFKLSGNALREAGLATGQTATVEFQIENGIMTASRVETPDAGVKPGEDFKFSGTVSSLGAGTVVVGGKTFKVADNTLLDIKLAAGKDATVEFQLNQKGEMEAIQIETPDTATKHLGEDIRFTGVVDSVGADNVVVGGKTFKLSDNALKAAGLAAGKTATVEFQIENGVMTAKKVETPDSTVKAGEDFKFSGTIEAITADTFVIGGKTFKKSAATLLDAGLTTGAVATVEFILQTDGSYLAKTIETGAGHEAEPTETPEAPKTPEVPSGGGGGGYGY